MKLPTIILPAPPSANQLFVAVGGKRIKSNAYRDWLSLIGPPIIAWKRGAPGSRIPLGGKIAIVIVVPRNRRRDLDNHIKPLIDALVFWRIVLDDRQVERIAISWGDGADAKVEIEEIENGLLQ